jgi:hypothetical protein
MSENKSLVSIVSEVNQIETMLIESGGEITPEIECALAVRDASVATKVDGYSYILDRLESLEEHYKNQAAFFSVISKQCKGAKDRLKDNLKGAMQEMGLDEIKGNDFRFKLSNSKPALEILDLGVVPKGYKKEVITVEIDKKALADDLAVGEIPGARLVPSFSLRKYANTKGGK